MSDQATLDRGEAQRARAARHAKLTRSIRALWLRDRHHPDGHLIPALHAGDRQVLLDWMSAERRHAPPGVLGHWLAANDMSELFYDDLRKQRLAGMAAIKERSDG